MTGSGYYLVLFVASVFFANLPFISKRLFLFFTPTKLYKQGEKPFWAMLSEWCVYLVFIYYLSKGVERKVTGVIQEQPWEFYWVIILLFVVCAFPGFVYRFLFLKVLRKPNKKPRKTK